jgi:hypothetical protein
LEPGNELGSQNVTDNNILRLREILSRFPGIKTADVYVMRAVTNRNVCFIPECGNHQVPLCHQNGENNNEHCTIFCLRFFASHQTARAAELWWLYSNSTV